MSERKNAIPTATTTTTTVPTTLFNNTESSSSKSQQQQQPSSIRIALLLLNNKFGRTGQRILIGIGLFLLFCFLIVIRSIVEGNHRNNKSWNREQQLKGILLPSDITAVISSNNNNIDVNNNNNNNNNKLSPAILLPEQPLPIRDDPNDELCINGIAPIRTVTDGKPIWMVGYPGSGYWILEKIVPKLTGYDVRSVYSDHTCLSDQYDDPTKPAVIGCISNYPFIQKDAPMDIVNSKINYHNSVLYIIRNPMDSIPSYYKRWYGNQQHIYRNHIQPPITEWIKWRTDDKIQTHLNGWKDVLRTWYYGIEGTSIRPRTTDNDNNNNNNNNNIGMYIPYEQLIDTKNGPELLKTLTSFFHHAGHSNILSQTKTNKIDYNCIWKEVIQPGKHHHRDGRKNYEWVYTLKQKFLFLQTIDELVNEFANMDDATTLIQLLQTYRKEIDSNIKIGF